MATKARSLQYGRNRPIEMRIDVTPRLLGMSA
jgi:hypothetical protein